MDTIDAKYLSFVFTGSSVFFLKAESHALIRPGGADGWHNTVINAKYGQVTVVDYFSIVRVYQGAGQQAPHAVCDQNDFMTIESSLTITFDQAS